MGGGSRKWQGAESDKVSAESQYWLGPQRTMPPGRKLPGTVSIHRRVSSSLGLSALVNVGCVLAAGCASGHRVTAATSGSNTPVIANSQEILQARRHEYRATGMMERGVADTTVVQMLVDTLGMVEQVRVGVSSENETVDLAALRVARVHRFEPARNRGKAVPVWVSLSISFVPGLCDTKPGPAELVLPPNPAGFRGVRSEAAVALLIDEEGLVREAKIETGAGSPDFDRAVLVAMRNSRFRPGTMECEPVEMWTTMKFGPGQQIDESMGDTAVTRRVRHAHVLVLAPLLAAGCASAPSGNPADEPVTPSSAPGIVNVDAPRRSHNKVARVPRSTRLDTVGTVRPYHLTPGTNFCTRLPVDASPT